MVQKYMTPKTITMSNISVGNLCTYVILMTVPFTSKGPGIMELVGLIVSQKHYCILLALLHYFKA